MTVGPRILLIEDDPAIARAVRRSLEMHRYRVEAAASGAAGRAAAEDFRPQVILLDLMLPDIDGLDLCRELRPTTDAAIIILSAIHDEADKVAALDGGADDYLTKPFSMPELEARIRVALRHRGAPADQVAECGLIRVDADRREVSVAGRIVRLTPKEFDLCRLLVAQQGRVLTQRYLLTQIWGPEYGDDRHVLRTFIYQLRAKLAEVSPNAAAQLVTEPAVGYRIVPPTP